jgi:hypothetical protein
MEQCFTLATAIFFLRVEVFELRATAALSALGK